MIHHKTASLPPGRLLVTATLSILFAAAAPFQSAWAQTAPALGTAQTFAVVAGDTVTSSGATTVNGDLGVSPGSAFGDFTGPPNGTVSGTIHAADAVSLQAKSDARTAYNNLVGQTCTVTFLVPTDLGGLNLVPGVYCFASSAGLTGTTPLTLTGTSSDVWVFKTVSTLISGPGSSIVMGTAGGAAGQACNVFWQIGSAATLDTTTKFIGTILAHDDISLKNGADVNGRVLAGMQASGGGAVTMIDDSVTPSACAASVAPTIAKAFAPDTIDVGGASTLTITLSNPNSTVATLTADLVDNFPIDVTIGGAASTTCGGAPTLTAVLHGSAITLSAGATIPTNGSCTVIVPVTASIVGPHVNLTSALATDKGTAPAAGATLTVRTPVSIVPTMSKAFSPANINVADQSLLTITFGNANAGVASLATFADTLPLGVTFVGVNTAATTCLALVTNDANTVTLGAGSIPAGGCTLTVTVTSLVPGLHLNTTGALVTDKGTAPPAIATLVVNQITIVKTFTSDTIVSGGVSLLTITVTNPNAVIATPVAFDDVLPTSPGAMLVATAIRTNTCGGTLTAPVGASSVVVTAGLLLPGQTCAVTVYVTAAVAGDYLNFLGTASAILHVLPTPQPGLSLTKTADPTTYDHLGQLIVYTYVVKNTGNVTLTGPFTVTDNKLGAFTCGTPTTILLAGQSVTCMRSYTIQAGDLGSGTNWQQGVTAKINTGTWLTFSNSTQNTTITGAPGVANGVYPCWCIQDHVPNDLHNKPAKLYSTTGGSLPADVAGLPWGAINYVLNHKLYGPYTGSGANLKFLKDVQTAVWVLLGETHPEFGISATAQQMINDGNAHQGFVPASGEIVAIIIYSDGMTIKPGSIQESICETKPMLGSIVNRATAANAAAHSSQVTATVTQAR
jgi:uncharacterized repeat protein (TIGR01451 family)